MKLLGLPESRAGLVPGKWLVRTQRKMCWLFLFLEWELQSTSGIHQLPASYPVLFFWLSFALYRLFQDSYGSDQTFKKGRRDLYTVVLNPKPSHSAVFSKCSLEFGECFQCERSTVREPVLLFYCSLWCLYSSCFCSSLLLSVRALPWACSCRPAGCRERRLLPKG